MQFEAVWGAGECCFASLTAVLGGMQFGMLVDWWMLFCELDGRVLGGMQFEAVWGAGECCFASLTAGCSGACSLGCWWTAGCWGVASLTAGC